MTDEKTACRFFCLLPTMVSGLLLMAGCASHSAAPPPVAPAVVPSLAIPSAVINTASIGVHVGTGRRSHHRERPASGSHAAAGDVARDPAGFLFGLHHDQGTFCRRERRAGFHRRSRPRSHAARKKCPQGIFFTVQGAQRIMK